MPKLDGLSGGTDDVRRSPHRQDANGFDENSVDIALLEKVPDKDYAEYLIESIKKTVKCEDSLVRQIVYVALSKDSTNPLNLGILAPTSEGKTYPVTEALGFWDTSDIMYVGSMSPKYLIRQNGVRVDSNNESITEREKELTRRIARARADRTAAMRVRIKRKQQDLNDVDRTGKPVIQLEPDEDEDDNDTLEDLEEQLDDLYVNARTVIDLQGKLLVFLEPPHPETWSIIKPILSHDKYFVEHPFVDRVDGNIRAIRVVTKGWPAVIMCSARIESEYDYWSEIQSRFIISSPNMVPEKYREGNILIGRRSGMPNALQQKLIINDSQTRVARECAKYLSNRIKKLSDGGVEDKKNLVWIPFTDLMSESLPANRGADNRINN